MSMCESILTIALVCTVKYLHYCDYYYTLGNDSQSTPKLIAYDRTSHTCPGFTTISARNRTHDRSVRRADIDPTSIITIRRCKNHRSAFPSNRRNRQSIFIHSRVKNFRSSGNVLHFFTAFVPAYWRQYTDKSAANSNLSNYYSKQEFP